MMTSLGLTLVLGSVAVGCGKANASPNLDQEPLVVHEWGTFTGFQGSDGASVDGMQHETEALPEFVHSRVAPMTSPLAVYGDSSRDVPVHHCKGKMETPVIYFHTKVARHVRVDVDYEGLLTQWYPSAERAVPAFSNTLQATTDLQQIKKSTLGWELDLVPAAERKTFARQVPAVPADSDWQKAREVNAAWVRTADKREADQYVFYRGLMRTVPQPRVLTTPSDNDRVTLMNDSANESLHAAFALDLTENEGRFVSLGAVAPGARELRLDGPRKPKATIVAEVTQAMTKALEAEGLYADEARAMVRTWSESWFSATGTRVLYLVPRATTDKTLPIRIEPKPSELVRVMVGRVEFLRPTKQAEVARDILEGGAVLTNEPPAKYTEIANKREEALRRLATLGRFAEPATRAVAATSTDPRMPDAASRVLGRFVR